MVRLGLYIKADLENVTNLEPADEEYEWHFRVKCTNCHEDHPKVVTLNRQDKRDLASGHDTANFVWKCTNCRRESSAKFEKMDNKSPPVKPYTFASSESQEFAPIVVLECRNLEFNGFELQGIWKCVGTESGTKFMDVAFEEGEWTDYDEKAAQPVGIMAIESEWKRV